MTSYATMDPEEYVSLLSSLMQHVEKQQNNPSEGVNPQEGLIADEVIAFLNDYKDVLDIQKHEYVEGRPNLVVKYAGTGSGTVSFVGMHMDVVPATPDSWDFDPFTLSRDSENPDKLQGRGVTDCLGHVALLAQVMKTLAVNKPALKRSVIAVFIANEECSDIPGVGVDAMVEAGVMDECKNGPVYWVDSADTNPTIGTGAAAVWDLTAKGKLFHSGLPHKAINAIELAMQGTIALQDFFHSTYGRVEQEDVYGFAVPSSLKPTVWSMPSGSTNQIPGSATVSGDIRVTPFYDIDEVMQGCKDFIGSLDVRSLSTSGSSRFALDDEDLTGSLELTWRGEAYKGIACDIESAGFKALSDSITAVKGECKPYSVTGSLPLVRELQEAGFDIQIVGFGEMSAYHANNEYAYLSKLMAGGEIVHGVIQRLEDAE